MGEDDTTFSRVSRYRLENEKIIIITHTLL